jgi:hypothetical protein
LSVVKALAAAAPFVGTIAIGFSLGRATAPEASDAPAAPPQVAAPAPTPAVPPAPVVPEEPAAPWAVGQARRCQVRAALDGAYVDPLEGPLVFSVEQRLDMTWRVTEVEGDVVRVEATIDGLALRSTARADRPDARPRWATDDDTGDPADASSPLRAAVGAPLRVVLEATTGAVREVHGAAAVQSAVFARAGVLDLSPQADARSAVRVSLLADEGGLRRALDGALRVLAPAPGAPAWTVRREPGDGPFGGAVDARVVPEPRDPRRLAWTGAFEGVFRTRDDRVVEVRRTLEGQASLAARLDRVETSTYEDAWTMTAQGTSQPLMRARAVVTVELGP